MASPGVRTSSRHEGSGDLISYSHSGLGSIYNASKIVVHNTTETAAEISATKRRGDQENYEQYRNVLLAGLARPHHDRDVLIDAKGKKVNGTCEWILENEYYKSLERGEISLLWISGGPGKGKTMMAIFLTQQLETSQDLKTIYFFCQASEEKHRSATYVLRSLVWQLTSTQAELTEHFAHELGSSDRAESQMTRTLLWSAFVNMSCDPRMLATVCIIDGLDECDDESRSWLADKIVGLNHDLEERSQASRSLRVIIISRSTIMELSQAKGIPRVKLDPDNDERVNAGIEKFVWTKMESLADRFDILSDPDRSDFVTSTGKKLLRKAEGTFLWIGIVMTELLKEKTQTDVHETVDKMPKGLPPLYDRMLQQIDQKHVQLCSRILLWLSVALEPLSAADLTAVVADRPAGTNVQQRSIHDQLILCGPLVEVNNGVVSLVHESARDFLLSTNEFDGKTVGPFRREPRQAHLEVAQACVALVLQCDASRLQRDPYSCYSGNTGLQYACEYWPEHARKSRELGSRLVDVFPSFFGAGSEIRYAWWQAYLKLMREWSRFFYMCGEEAPEIHQACFLGIVPWASSILCAQSAWPRRWVSKMRSSRRGNANIFPLAIAAEQGHIEIARLLLQNNADVDSTGKRWDGTCTALHIALENRNVSIAHLLLDHGASAKSRSESNMTALHFAAYSGVDEEMVRALLIRGAEVDARDKWGKTALHLTRMHTIASTLIDHRADVGAVDIEGQTPLHDAVYGAEEAVVRLLIKHGADLHARDHRGRTPLHFVDVEDPLAYKAVIEAGSDVNVRDDEGETPLHLISGGIMSEKTRLFCVQALLMKGADVNATSHRGTTPLHLAALYGDYEVAQKLLEFRAKIDTKDKEGETPLHKAVRRKRVHGMDDAEVSWLLIEAGANIEARNQQSQTPLHVATPPSACVLLARRADASARDNNGMTPLQCAQEQGDRMLVSMLQYPWESGEEHTSFQAIRADFDRFVARNPDWPRYLLTRGRFV